MKFGSTWKTIAGRERRSIAPEIEEGPDSRER